MILDAKEQWYTLENLEKVEHLQLLPIDADAIENGKRCLEIPEGVKSISEDAVGEETSSAPLNQDDISEGSRGNRIGTVSVSGGKGAACTSCENASSGQSGICICGCISEVS